jgi:hypothetical protein
MTTKAISIATVTVVVLAVCSTSRAGPAAPKDITEVVQAWTARQDRVKSFRVEWTDHVTVPKGRTSRNRPPGGAELKIDVPPLDLIFDAPKSLVIEGARSRFRYQARHWSVLKSAAYTENCDTEFDGTEYKTAAIYDPPVVTNNGGIRRMKIHPDLAVLSCRPTVVALRGTEPTYRVYDVARFEPTGKIQVVNRVPCAELVRQNIAARTKEILYVDPAREFVLVRAAAFESDRPGYQLDVSHQDDPIAGWLPSKWSYVTYDPYGKVYASGRCTANRWEINPPLTDADLKVAPAPGTLMIDATSRRQTKYVVQPDGQPGKRVPRGARISYDELAKAGPEPVLRRWSFLWLSVAAVFGGSLGLLGWRAVARVRGRRAEFHA